jgi:hypothetical protein
MELPRACKYCKWWQDGCLKHVLPCGQSDLCPYFAEPEDEKVDKDADAEGQTRLF